MATHAYQWKIVTPLVEAIKTEATVPVIFTDKELAVFNAGTARVTKVTDGLDVAAMLTKKMPNNVKVSLGYSVLAYTVDGDGHKIMSEIKMQEILVLEVE